MTDHKQNFPKVVDENEIDDTSCTTNQSPHNLDENDGRDIYDYKSKYDASARMEIRLESIFLFVLLATALLLLFFTWNDVIPSFLDIEEKKILIAKKYIYYFSSGILGGVVFSIKYFYRVIARGWWHQDRRAWRIFSPAISGVVALMIGVLIDASLLKSPVVSGPSIVSIGFLAGYFADEAVGKMYEIANVIFGTNNNTKKG